MLDELRNYLKSKGCLNKEYCVQAIKNLHDQTFLTQDEKQELIFCYSWLQLECLYEK